MFVRNCLFQNTEYMYYDVSVFSEKQQQHLF